MLRRRISIKVEHTEVTLSFMEMAAQGPTSTGEVSEELAPPRHCPDCGALWLLNLRDAVSTLNLTVAQLTAAASEGRLHLFCSQKNEIWICGRSIQQMKENF